MIPLHALPHRVTVVQPATVTDQYGNEQRPDYGPGATRIPNVPAMLTLSTVHSEENTTARDTGIGSWTIVTNFLELTHRDRIERAGVTFEVVSPPAPLSTFRGLHHVEAILRSVD